VAYRCAMRVVQPTDVARSAAIRGYLVGWLVMIATVASGWIVLSVDPPKNVCVVGADCKQDLGPWAISLVTGVLIIVVGGPVLGYVLKLPRAWLFIAPIVLPCAFLISGIGVTGLGLFALIVLALVFPLTYAVIARWAALAAIPPTTLPPVTAGDGEAGKSGMREEI